MKRALVILWLCADLAVAKPTGAALAQVMPTMHDQAIRGAAFWRCASEWLIILIRRG